MWRVCLLGIAVVGWWEYGTFALARYRAWGESWNRRVEVIHQRHMAAIWDGDHLEAFRWGALYGQAMRQWAAERAVRTQRLKDPAIPRRWVD